VIDDDFCPKIGTDKQHRYACVLASKAGWDTLRMALAEFGKCRVSELLEQFGSPLDVGRASGFIDWLKDQAEDD
jgi:hypothetical protein